MRKPILIVLVSAVFLLGAAAGNIRWDQLSVPARHGDGEKGQSFTGTSISGNCAKFDAAGNVIDAGAPCGTSSGSSWALNTVTYSVTPTFDLSLGSVQAITLAGNVTSSTVSNPTSGMHVSFHLCQDATGGRTFAWDAHVHGGMVIGSTASLCSDQSFDVVGAELYAASPGVPNQ